MQVAAAAPKGAARPKDQSDAGASQRPKGAARPKN